MSTSSSTLSPFDMTGLGAGFGLYRPRRPSYTYATQAGRQRTESYRYAVKKSAADVEEQTDFIEGYLTKRGRKESYVRATRRGDDAIELRSVLDTCPSHKPTGNNVMMTSASHVQDNIKNDEKQQKKQQQQQQQQQHQQQHQQQFRMNHTPNNRMSVSLTTSGGGGGAPDHIDELKTAIACRSKITKPKQSVYKLNDDLNTQSPNHNKGGGGKKLPITDENHVGCQDNTKENVGTPCSELSSTVPSVIVFTFKKNLVFLCISFITLFSSFRAIQNLQSSINDKNNLGIIAMAVVHGTMFLTCLWAPSIINKLSAKWALVIGMFSFLTWIGANFYPTFYTLIPTAIFSGCGQGILWTAEISYILKLAFDSSRVSRGNIDKEVLRFHGVFLACFQTTHIWGNLISSFVFNFYKEEEPEPFSNNILANLTDMDTYDGDRVEADIVLKSCGVLHPCGIPDSRKTTELGHILEDKEAALPFANINEGKMSNTTFRNFVRRKSNAVYEMPSERILQEVKRTHAQTASQSILLSYEQWRNHLIRSGNTNDKIQKQSGNTNDNIQKQSGNTNDNIQKQSGNTNDKIQKQSGNTNDKIQKQSGNTNDKIQKQPGNTNDKIQKQPGNTNDKIQKQPGNTNDKIQKQPGNTNDKIQKQPGNTNDKIQKQPGNTNDKIQKQPGNTNDKIQKQPGNTNDKIQKQPGNTNDKIQKQPGNTNDKIQKQPGNTNDKIQKQPGNTNDKIQKQPGNTNDKIQKQPGNTNDKIQKQPGNTNDKIQKQPGNTNDKIQKQPGNTNDKIQKQPGNTNDKIQKQSGNTNDKIQKQSEYTNDKIQKQPGNTNDKIQKQPGNTKDKIQKQSGNTNDKIQKQSGNTGQNAETAEKTIMTECRNRWLTGTSGTNNHTYYAPSVMARLERTD
ncbi:uncharacterized protein LOC110441312 [Mizuhopecten yessoensis]|uniref:uncharacterized protein LOC110441312 n=1 Tax=Mizuhopecten yessoensis TaxID=6573 RepID=UPI000B45DEEC|nr:uncharacterized protein LOC110441312 [Mizuhopecten yessoensis]